MKKKIKKGQDGFGWKDELITRTTTTTTTTTTTRDLPLPSRCPAQENQTDCTQSTHTLVHALMHRTRFSCRSSYPTMNGRRSCVDRSRTVQLAHHGRKACAHETVSLSKGRRKRAWFACRRPDPRTDSTGTVAGQRKYDTSDRGGGGTGPHRSAYVTDSPHRLDPSPSEG